MTREISKYLKTDYNAKVCAELQCQICTKAAHKEIKTFMAMFVESKKHWE